MTLYKAPTKESILRQINSMYDILCDSYDPAKDTDIERECEGFTKNANKVRMSLYAYGACFGFSRMEVDKAIAGKTT